MMWKEVGQKDEIETLKEKNIKIWQYFRPRAAGIFHLKRATKVTTCERVAVGVNSRIVRTPATIFIN